MRRSTCGARPSSIPRRHGPMTGCRSSNIPGTTATSWSPPAAASACTGKKINISIVLAEQKLGIKEVDDGIWLVSSMHYDLGYIDLEQRTLQTIDNPFGSRLSPMSPGRTLKKMAVPRGLEPLTFGLGNRCSIRLSYGTVCYRDMSQTRCRFAMLRGPRTCCFNRRRGAAAKSPGG